MKICGRCGTEKPESEFNKDRYSKTGLRSQCKQCMKLERKRLRDHYQRWRQRDDVKRWYAEYRRKRYLQDKEKVRARNATKNIESQPCEICGDTKSEAHHDDYSKPLDVRWLCRRHHVEWHCNNDARSHQ